MSTLTMGNFLSLFDLMESEDKVALAKRVLDQLHRDGQLQEVKDPLQIMVLMRFCEVQANSINALSIQGILNSKNYFCTRN